MNSKPMDSVRAGRLPDDQRQRVLELRRAHSLRQVAEITGLPLGTIKTLCSRSGAFRDNPQHRALFTLPPIRLSLNTAVSVPELPPQQVVTGDREIDAMLWLREVVSTGQAALIAKAHAAAKKIKTPAAELEKRYRDFLTRTYPGNPFAALSSFGFADLDGLAESSTAKLARQQEARGRFGGDDNLYAEVPAEQFCKRALEGVGTGKYGLDFDAKQVDSKFYCHPELLPRTLSDCLHELNYWHELYRLRTAVHWDSGDPIPPAQERDQFAFRMLARIRARTPAEAVDVFRYLSESGRMDSCETEAILLNLLGATKTSGATA